MAKGLTEPVTHESTFTFNFPDCEKLPPPVLPFINVSFAYSGKAEDYLYQVGGCRHTLHIMTVDQDRCLPTALSYIFHGEQRMFTS